VPAIERWSVMPTSIIKEAPAARAYRRAVWTALALQVPMALLLPVVILDRGRSAAAAGYALIGFWLSVALITYRRRDALTRADLRYIRWGHVPLVLAAVVFAGWLALARP
jgi:hypothetical protein